MPAFHLLLLRDGQLLQTKDVAGFTGARTWTETFSLAENEEGRHNYDVQMMPPALPDLIVAKQKGSVQVSISNEKDLRILFVQGALTWDYKFVLRALSSDPAIRMTGLSPHVRPFVLSPKRREGGRADRRLSHDPRSARLLSRRRHLQSQGEGPDRCPAGNPHPLLR